MLVTGLDFGTAYTKCIVRDAMVTNPGKAYPIAFELNQEVSHLMPSVVYSSQDGSVFYTALDDVPANTTKLDYIKMRLVASVDKTRANAWKSPSSKWSIKVVVAWYLAQVLAATGQRMRELWPDFGQHPEDVCFINICVPIAYADGSPVESELMQALYAAQAVLGPLGTEPPTLEQISAALHAPARLKAAADLCYSYPETSSNLQSFLKSRARKPGLYLLLDVGAGTVDLTFFQLLRDASDDAPLRYYHAAVLEAGSSRLELLAVQITPSLTLHDVLAHKEGRHRRPSKAIEEALVIARKKLHDEVGKGVGDGVKETESKLHSDRQTQLAQMRSVKLMFSGGGFSHDPYELAARFFQRARKWSHEAPIEPISEPEDLSWNLGDQKVKFNRLSVAYGLSFPRYELDGHKFPSQVTVNPNATPRPRPQRWDAPSKDDV